MTRRYRPAPVCPVATLESPRPGPIFPGPCQNAFNLALGHLVLINVRLPHDRVDEVTDNHPSILRPRVGSSGQPISVHRILLQASWGGTPPNRSSGGRSKASFAVDAGHSVQSPERTKASSRYQFH